MAKITKTDAVNTANLTFPVLAEQLDGASTSTVADHIREVAKDLYLKLLEVDGDFMWLLNLGGQTALTKLGLHKWVDAHGDGYLAHSYFADPDPAFTARFDTLPAINPATEQPTAESPFSKLYTPPAPIPGQTNVEPTGDAQSEPKEFEVELEPHEEWMREWAKQDKLIYSQPFDPHTLLATKGLHEGRILGFGENEPFRKKSFDDLQKEAIIANEARQNLVILNSIAADADLSDTTRTMVRQDRRLYIEVLRGLMLGNMNTNGYEEVRDGSLDVEDPEAY